jgi:hypothetical protein
MRRSRFAGWVFAVIVSAGGAARASTWQEQIPMPKPGPEHAVLKLDEGVWDAVIEIMPGPGMPTMTSKGVETNTMGCGGLCLITDFKGELMPGVAFSGHGTTAWDAIKKKYVGTWTDSMAQGIAIGEMTWDAAAKKMTGWLEGPNATGTVVRTRTVVEQQDAKRVMNGYAAGPDGAEMQVMRITYTRRK